MNSESLVTSRPANKKRFRTARGEKTYFKLLEAAEVVFGEKGYYETGVIDITRKAQVAQGTFYKHYSSKKEIFTDLIHYLRHILQTEIREATRDLKKRSDVEREAYRTFFNFVRRHHTTHRLLRQAEFVDESLFRSHYQNYAKSYARGLVQAMQQGEFRSINPELAAYALMGMGDFVGMRWPQWEAQDMPEHLLDDLMQLVLHGLLCQGEDKPNSRMSDSPQPEE